MLLIFSQILLAYFSLACAQPNAAIRNTTAGQVAGVLDAAGFATFHSIPYAAPPVNQLRFRAPQPLTPWTNIRNASDLPQICPQLQLIDNSTLLAGAEDCLYLHLYQPAACTSAQPCSVLVFFPGGAMILGDGYEFGLYDATNLAKMQQLVVVSVTFRQGPFGYMALNSLQQEDPDHSTGNAALQDQRFSLLWVQANIKSFGGDPARVTIFGESAGGFSIAWHLVSPKSAGLFRSAIMESGSSDSPQFFQPVKDAIEFNTLYANAIGCPDVATVLSCLRALPMDDITLGFADWLNPK